MNNVSVMRGQCYAILQGVERSIAANIIRNFNLDDPEFLTDQEHERAFNRLRIDYRDVSEELDDVNNLDLLSYLDLGDLLALFNRHRSDVINVSPPEIKEAVGIIETHKVHAIRKRVMHPVRPLEDDDLSNLTVVSELLRNECPSMAWDALDEGLASLTDPDRALAVAIPQFWTDEPKTAHNLPIAEYEETGFIGRREERQKLMNWLQTDQRVITVVGPGGIGKTALTLQVCYDLLDSSQCDFENIVWVSLKTQYLTADGIRDIANAVDNQAQLINEISEEIEVDTGNAPSANWDDVIAHMRSAKTLLVIDNLETLGSDIRDLAIAIPQGSKLLLTSRVGLGEIEVRYTMPDFNPRDANILIRRLGVAYGCAEINDAGQGVLNDYCNRLHYNPLLIKWFVQAVSKGTNPTTILTNDDFEKALSFCVANVYDGLSSQAKIIVASLLAAREALSQTQIRELVNISRVPFEIAERELRRSNFIESKGDNEGSTMYQIRGMIHRYLSHHHGPSDQVVKNVRRTLQGWQLEQDRSSLGQAALRYSSQYVHVETLDHRIAAKYLRDAHRAIRGNDVSLAEEALNHAIELTPDWWEVHRVNAHVLSLKNAPIYEIENAFELSINYNDNDINRQDYAAYLMRTDSNDRALEQIDAALMHEHALVNVLRSMRGVAFMRMGRINESLAVFESVWQQRENTPVLHYRRVQGTQYAEAYRRLVEQLKNQGNGDGAGAALQTGIEIVDQTADECGWDGKLSEMGIRLLAESIGVGDMTDNWQNKHMEVAQRWDSNEQFTHNCDGRRVSSRFQRNTELAKAMPNSSKIVLEDAEILRFDGKVFRIQDSYGFVYCSSLGDVYINPSSMVRRMEWEKLQVGVQVTFGVMHSGRSPIAIRLEYSQYSLGLG